MAPPSRQCASATRAASAGSSTARGDRRPAVGCVEERKGVDPVAEHRHAERLEQLGGRADVEERLDSRRDDHAGDPGAGTEVGRDVGRGREAAMNAAEPACSQEADADGVGDRQRAAHRRRADRALHGARSEVARPQLARVRGEPLELLGSQPDDDAAVEDADRRRGRSRVAHRGFAREAHLDARGRGEPVRDERRLERDDRPLLGEGGLDLVADADQEVHGGEVRRRVPPSARAGSRRDPRRTRRNGRRGSGRTPQQPPPGAPPVP